LTDLSTIRDLCARYDFALSKGFGQNFIINPGICPRIAEAAGIGPGWGALEVGPGIGVLTEQLCKRADKVVSIEVDKRRMKVVFLHGTNEPFQLVQQPGPARRAQDIQTNVGAAARLLGQFPAD